ncbi:fluoride efflux transporter CrcB [Nocardia sp. NPDC023852]|uniref:fluoride efflux transporter CrcB n=1 Tax=unclassified Nocardia TaxID=2637762 RepID=UPI0033C4D370|nr:fluoride efflux transporter CrcB [Nocardia sp. NBC_00881]
MTVLPVVPSGKLGESARYPAEPVVPARFDSPLPSCTQTVTIVGSARFGGLGGAGAGDRLLATAGIGFRGAATTLRTFGFETIRPVAVGARACAAGTAVIDVAAVATTGRSWP